MIVIMLLVCAIPGIGLSIVELIQLKIVIFAVMPKASVPTASAVNPGFLRSCRKA
jgi:hypothetical protein